ncbi:MAG TPA: hypothetical protein VGP33_19045 [Chloroflexota bacterium]|nr:hypothetical protein [Chloroflexota bacterium]
MAALTDAAPDALFTAVPVAAAEVVLAAVLTVAAPLAVESAPVAAATEVGAALALTVERARPVVPAVVAAPLPPQAASRLLTRVLAPNRRVALSARRRDSAPVACDPNINCLLLSHAS